MSVTRQELLALALGQLSSEDQQRVGQALDHDPALRTALRRDLDALTSLLADLDVQAQTVPQAPTCGCSNGCGPKPPSSSR
ncbi:hypothetical protein MSS93_11565 [Deinococcus radiodurans]|nr:hypothetical protein MSS93_11565 [Deinococcus radiodurans]